MESYIGQTTDSFVNPQSASFYAQRGDALSKNELTDRRALSPLLSDYDGTIQRLKSQIDSYHEEQKELRGQVDKLVAENDRLSQKLKDAARAHIESNGRAGTGNDDDGALSNLQQQLSMALREKDAAVDMWHASVQEIEKLERQLQTARLDPRMQSLELQAQQIKDQYVRTVSDLSQQTTQLQEELKKTRNDLKVSNIQVIDLRNTLEELRNEMMLKEQQRGANEVSRLAVEKSFKEFNHQLSDVNAQLVARALEIDQLRSEKQALEQQLTEFRSRASESENRSSEAMNKLRGSFQMVENAITERDEAFVKEKQAQEEISRLQEAISKLLDEAGVRTRQEVDNVKKQCNVNLSKLVDEVQRLELESSEKQAELDRAIREKRAIESELEKVYKEGIMQGGRDGVEFNDLTLRACNAEKHLDEAQLKIDSLSNQIRRMEIMHRQEVSSLDIELESCRDRYKVASEELSSSNDDRVKLTEKVDDLKSQLHKLQQERSSSSRALSKQVAVLSQELQVKEKEYEAKLQSLEDCHRHKILELRDMMTVQQRMSAKWKEECNTITQKMEVKLTESQGELKNERRRTEDLTRLLRDCRNKTVEMEAKMQQCSRNMQAMESKFIDVEHKSNGSSPKVQWRRHEKTSTSSFIESRRRQQRELEYNLRHSMSPLNCTTGSS